MMDASEVIWKRFALSSEIDISYLSYPHALLSYHLFHIKRLTEFKGLEQGDLKKENGLFSIDGVSLLIIFQGWFSSLRCQITDYFR